MIKKLTISLFIFIFPSITFGALPTVFKQLQNYDTLGVENYFKSGGSVDLVYTNKVSMSSSFSFKTTKTSITLLQEAIWAYQNSKYEDDNSKTISAKKNLKLVLSQLKNSTNFEDQINKAFTLSIPIGEIDIVRTIYELGADINTRCKVCFGRSAILIAIGYHENFELIKYLLSLKPDLSITDYDGKGFLAYAAQMGNLSLIKYFLEELEVNVNSKDNKGNTPLLTAAEFGEYEVFNYLIEKGADIKAINKKNETVLHMAAYSDNEKFFRHVFYLSGFDLWSKKWSVPNVIKYAADDHTRTFIIRYTIDKYGFSEYKKLKRKNFFKRLTGN